MKPLPRVLLLLMLLVMPALPALSAGLLPLPASAAPPQACDAQLAAGSDLQAAIDALPADRPASLCLAAGEYSLQHMLRIDRDHLQLRGAGADTVLRLRDGTREPVIVVGDIDHEQPDHVVRDVAIEQLRIVGATAAHEFTAERPWLSNSAIAIRRGEQIRLRGLQLISCRSACILTEHDTREVLVENNQVIGSVWDGVSFNRTARVTMRGNEIRGNAAAGITVEHLEDSVIADNTIEANGSHGIYLSDAWRNQISGNRFSNNRNAGVFLTCAVRFRDPGPVLCWDNSISQGNVVENNIFTRNQFAYAVGADRAANCAGPDWIANLWRNNRSDAPNRDPQPDRFGLCMRSS